MKNRLLPIFVFVTCTALASPHTITNVSRICILVPDQTTLNTIWSTGIDFEGSSGEIGGEMEFVAGPHELERLTAQGISYRITINDLTAFYQARLTTTHTDALMGFGYGSMGGYFTNEEVLGQLDSMILLYPALITTRQLIGSTTEGRSLWAVKISDNPLLDEPDEPEVLFTALHHAREPEGMMSTLYYMWWLLQNYGTDPDATYLVNNRQMWFIPVVNADGYVYNQTTYPAGGGMWRKNLRANADGSFGVDLNRNYGPAYMWDSPLAPYGSSTEPASETYRGTAPFSEPEDIAIDTFMRAHSIKTCLNYHTYGNYLIYPFSYIPRESRDSLIFRDWAYEMTAVNRFTSGTDIQTVAYSTRGTSDDYMYGDTTKQATYAMTPEVGVTGFWPPTTEIFPLAIGNLGMNKHISFVAGQYSTIESTGIQTADGTEFIKVNEDFTLSITIKNKGRGPANNLTVAVSSSLSAIQFPSPNVQIGQLAAQGQTKVAFTGHADRISTTGVPFRVTVLITDLQGYRKMDTLTLYLGTPTVLLADSASGGTSKWTTGTGWGVTTSAHTPPNAFTDSPAGPYAANANNSLTLVTPLNLTGFKFVQLKFFAAWSIQPTWDFATVEISTNNGSTWTTLRTKLSHAGSRRNSATQPAGSWGYDSYTPGQEYVEQETDLTPYIGKQIKLRFRVVANYSDQREGFFVDDIRVYGYANTATGMNENEDHLPKEFTLCQNFPNPFNPSTHISFSLPIETHVRLEVFTVLGESVATLVDEIRRAGTYAVYFSADNLASGVYFYRLHAGDFVQMRKLLLLR